MPARLIALILALWLSSPLGAQPAAAGPADAASAPTAPGATLSFFNREIATFRVSLLGLTPADRARRARDQLSHLPVTQTPSVQLQAVPGGQAVLADGVHAFILLDADAEPGEAADRNADKVVQALSQALQESHDARSLRFMAASALRVAAATGLLILALWLLNRARRWLNVRLSSAMREHGEVLRLGGAALLGREHLMSALRALTRATSWLVVVLLTLQWLGYALRQFPFTRPWGEQLQQSLLDLLEQIALACAQALPNLVVAAVIYLLARFLLAALRPFFRRAEEGAVHLGWLDTDTARPTWRILSIGVWLFALAMAYPYLPGAQTEAFRGLSVFVGLMVSLGASNLVGQAASGLILMYTRILRVGDYVRIGEHEGTVTQMGAFAARIRTGMGEELSVPNTLVMSGVTRNYSRNLHGAGYMVDSVVTIGYDAPWRQVHAMLIEAAHRTPGVLKAPRPQVFQTALSDFYVEYRLTAQALPDEPRPRAEVLSALHANILDVFNEHGVQIMSPHYLNDPASPKIVPPGRWHEPPASCPDDA
jgi:small-conductance mechanosensitive channel